jgi:hypothetical protein
VVDILRSFHVTQARLADGSIIHLRWYKTKPDAPALGLTTCFGSPVWEGSGEERDEFTGAGVFYDPLVWAPTRLGGCSDYNVVGSPEAFRTGNVLPSRPPPKRCCGFRVGNGGGAVLGGSGWAEIARGGMAAGGAALNEAGGARDEAFGGAALGGLAAEGRGVDLGIGGAALGGLAIHEAGGARDLALGGMSKGGEVCDMCVQTITVSQEITGGGTGNTVNVGHAASGITAGSYGDATHVPRLTIDNEGHVTAATPTLITPAAGNVTGLATVATTGHASDLTGLATVALTGAASDLTGLATVATSGSATDLSSGTLAIARLDVKVPVQRVNGQFPQNGKWNFAFLAGPKIRITAPDGTTTDTSLTGTPNQTFTIASIPANTWLAFGFFRALTNWTTSGPSLTFSLGYSGGSGGSSSNTSKYQTAISMPSTTAGVPVAFSNQQPDCENPTSAWNFTLTINASGGNVNTITAGSTDVEILTGLLS